MKITALHTARLANEFKEDLAEATIVNLRKSEKDKTVTMHFEAEDKKYSLVFHFGGNTSFLYLQGGHRPRIVTTNFLPQLLGCRIDGVRQVGFDRIIEMDLAEGERPFRLIFELFGLSSNLYLTDANLQIITSIRKSKLGLKKYQPPEPLQLENPLEFEPDSVAGMLLADPEKTLLDAILQTFSGLNEGMLRTFADSIEIDLDDTISEYSKEQITAFLDRMKNTCNGFVNPQNELSYDPESQTIFLTESAEFSHASRLSDILHEFSRIKQSSQPEKSEKTQYLGMLKRAIKKESKKIEKLQRQLEEAKKYPEMQKKAELLSANLHQIKKGVSEIELEDIYSERGGTVKIELDKTLTPAKNMEKIFTQARKYKDKIPGIEKELVFTKNNLGVLENLQSELSSIPAGEIPVDLKDELRKAGIIVERKGERPKKAEIEHLPYREFKTSRGEAVLVGKSARDNDQLTFKVARKNDLWFHSQQTAGSHVILRRPNRAHEFQKPSIIEAAEIAAFYSPAKNSETVPVIYTEVKYVRKARKGSPGLVLAERTKSILVTPRRPKN
jgi:predicted ribosome quality control (RQC) complex YloA/Tae2 family protein